MAAIYSWVVFVVVTNARRPVFACGDSLFVIECVDGVLEPGRAPSQRKLILHTIDDQDLMIDRAVGGSLGNPDWVTAVGVRILKYFLLYLVHLNL